MFDDKIKEVLAFLLPSFQDKTRENLKATRTMRTWNLYNSIKPTAFANNTQGLEMLYYGEFLDKGTSRIAPKPFIEPSFKLVMDTYQEYVVQELGQGVAEEINLAVTSNSKFKLK